MKTKEFIKEAEVMGFIVNDDNNTFFVKNKYGKILAYVCKYKSFAFSTGYHTFFSLDENKKQQLFKLLTEYASTPIKERQKEKKYMYLLKRFSENEKDRLHLTYDWDNEDFGLAANYPDMQFIFKENDPLLENVNLDMFEKIEVK